MKYGHIRRVYNTDQIIFFIFYGAKARIFFKLWVTRLFILFTKTHTRWNDFLFLITDDHDFRPQTCTNGLVFRECKHIKNIFEDVYFTKNLFHITLKVLRYSKYSETCLNRILDKPESCIHQTPVYCEHKSLS